MSETVIPVEVIEVTVFPDRARVRCEGSAKLESGSQTVVVDELPLTLEMDSLRAQGRATAPSRLLGVDVARRHFADSPAPEVVELEKRIEELQDQHRAYKDDEAGLLEYAQYLRGMRQATATYAKGLALGRSSVQDQQELHDYLRQEDKAMRAEMRQLEVETRSLDLELEKLKRELSELQSKRSRERYRALIDVELEHSGEFTLTVTYVVFRAGWKPLYDARLAQTEDDWHLDMTVLAQIEQRTGQDWPAVQLNLSTARPALHRRLPEPEPWYVDVLKPHPRPMRVAAVAAPAAGMAKADALDVEAPEADLEQASEQVLATANDAGITVEFQAAGKVGVPSDGSPHKTTLAHYALRPAVDYVIAPRVAQAAYRRVTVPNSTSAPLLEGQINLFVGDEFVGGSHLPYTPRGDEIELLAGIEERIKVKRELVRRDVDKRLLRERRRLSFGYEIQIENLLTQPVSVELWDQIPVPKDERIRVKLERTDPQPSEVTELNQYTWSLELSGKETMTLRYDFTVEHPPDLAIIGLDI